MSASAVIKINTIKNGLTVQALLVCYMLLFCAVALAQDEEYADEGADPAEEEEPAADPPAPAVTADSAQAVTTAADAATTTATTPPTTKQAPVAAAGSGDDELLRPVTVKPKRKTTKKSAAKPKSKVKQVIKLPQRIIQSNQKVVIMLSPRKGALPANNNKKKNAPVSGKPLNKFKYPTRPTSPTPTTTTNKL